MSAATDIPVALLADDARRAEADTLARRAADLPARGWVEHRMAMPWSLRVRGPHAHDEATAQVVARAYALVAEIDEQLSPFRPGSALERYRRGELALADAPWSLREVHRRCLLAREETDGAFDAWGWRDGFDPTGLTKSWAVAQVLDVLAEVDGDVAVGAGGDVAVLSRTGLPWRVGVEDPEDRSRLLGHVDLRDGAVATSGTAARGEHVRIPGGGAATGLRQATVVASSVVRADVWATTALVLGAARARERLHALPGTSGLLVEPDGTLHRWATP